MNLFKCHSCRKPAFLIRGYCETCEPALHRQHHERMAAYEVASLEYMHETGLEPLSDWIAFEEWAAAR